MQNTHGEAGWLSRQQRDRDYMVPRAPLWRSRPAAPEKMRALFERYVEEFESYAEQRRAA